MALYFFSSFLLWILLLPLSTSQNTTQECPQKCGTVEIHYPFGIGNGCFHSGFEVSCNLQSQTPMPFLAKTHLQVLSVYNGGLRANSTHYMATDCANQNRTLTHVSLPEDGPFSISDDNSFMAVGCDTVAVIADNDMFASGCVSLCSTRNSVTNGSCSGVGCCELAIPKGTRYLGLGSSNMFGYTKVSSFNNCSYAFVVERRNFIFMEPDLRDFLRTADIAMKLEWAIGDANCSNTSLNICGKNSFCFESILGFGYLCNCSDGYAGNPYLNGSKGCQGM
ncbi:wall-associated receptor kinase 2-like [Magnolia sinica]|uniref:wall-associated receptor kinase 2-like n=1 Tax=Magnolia sinica TaxID=86752 RepID=UPI0026580703|nr:wall-associated receptor kinase 2-like [Magnolia sinica]